MLLVSICSHTPPVVPSGATTSGESAFGCCKVNPQDYSFGSSAGQVITFSQQWRLTSNKSTSSTTSDISANLEVVDSDGYGGLGGTMTQSSGIFTFPSTGIYLILAKGGYSASGGSTSNYNEMDLHTTTDGSSFNRAAIGWCYIASGGYGTAACDFMFDVTNTSTHKVKFRGASASSNAYLTANTNDNQTHFTFIRLGDT